MRQLAAREARCGIDAGLAQAVDRRQQVEPGPGAQFGGPCGEFAERGLDAVLAASEKLLQRNAYVYEELAK